MVHFYLLADEAPTPRAPVPERLPPAGQLSQEAFTQLQRAHLIESRLDYRMGFRWSSHAVQAKIQLLLQQFPQTRPAAGAAATPEQQLLVILLNALAQPNGLFALAG